ncbi:MAG TPA: biopolymer transporter ExbD [Bacteroidetes bacterium]|nr:biopolymer transport protein ExbD [bacterium BMS3Bbin04]HDO64718.1 biopolymer transporter ExbD [Bacteroidota bacterium]HEX03843.1 biopolymer transporter ExbD [Bacteroidota bacterium]
MALLKRRVRSNDEIPTASMPDIVFMLLIFFLVTTTIDVDMGIPMQLPDRGGEFKVNPENISNVLINAQGQILIDDELTDITQVQEVISSKVETRGLDADGKPKLIVSIKTEKATTYNSFIQVLDAVKGAGATKISIAEPEK